MEPPDSSADHLDRLKAALADRYRIESEIDSGGMATVYRARDLKHERMVAIKVLRPELAEAIGADRFLREIRTTANLTHPHILPLHDSGEADGLLYYVMPFVKGESLRDRLERESQLPIEDAVQIAREVADALAYAHRNGIVHRDVKPANIMLDEGHALLADFGIAKAKDGMGSGETKLTGLGTSLGTPSYMSPEQISGEGKLDGRADQYALGCVLFEMLAGHPPFTGADIQTVMRQHLAVDAPAVTQARTSVPMGLAQAVHRSLAKAPADRFTRMESFGEALAEAPVTRRGKPEASASLRIATPRGRRVAATTILALAGVAAVLFWKPWTWSSSSGPPPADRPFTVLASLEGTAEKGLRESVAVILETELNQGHPVQTLPADRVSRTKTLMELPDTAVLNRARALDLATRLGVSTVTLPRLDEIDGAYAFTLRVEDRSSGAQRAGATGRAASGSELIGVVQDAVWEVQEALGETPDALEATGRFEEVVTPSLEALQLYTEGRSLTWSGSPRRAIPLLQDAVEADSSFAMAWHMLSMAYGRVGMDDSARAAAAQRDRYPERLSDGRRANVEFFQNRNADVALWDQAYERFEANVLRLRREGEWEDYSSNYALGLAEISWTDSAYATQMQLHARHMGLLRERYPSAEIYYQFFQIPFLLSTLLAADKGVMDDYLAFMEDSLGLAFHEASAPWTDFASAMAEGEWNRADSLREPLLEVLSADSEWGNVIGAVNDLAFQLDAVRGRIGEHHRARMEREGEREALILELVYGLPSLAPEQTGLELDSRGMDDVWAFTLHGTRAALLGDTLESARGLRRLEAMRDTATSERFERAFEPWFVLMEAGPAYQARDWPRLIRVLEPLEAVFRERGYGIAMGDTYLVWWLLARAYEEVGRPADAIRVLEEIVGLPRYRGADRLIHGLPWPAAQLQLGNLYRGLGDSDQAAEHYRVFLSTFTDPEPEFEWMREEARAGLDDLLPLPGYPPRDELRRGVG